MVITAMSLPHRPQSAAMTRVAGLLALIGVCFILGSTPAAYVGFGTLITIGLIAFLAVARRDSERFTKAFRILRIAMVVAVCAAAIIEARWAYPGPISAHMDKSFPNVHFPRMIVVGDSLSEGLGEKFPPWPDLPEMKELFEVINLAHAGDGTQLALLRIEGKLVQNAIVVIEIGGNDMLGSTSADEFEKYLDQLLANLKGETRCLVMFELPLLPNKVAYGRIQRRLAKKYNVFLIPKLYLANVITAKGATEDGLHLSESGTWLMARTVVHWIAPGAERNFDPNMRTLGGGLQSYPLASDAAATSVTLTLEPPAPIPTVEP